MFSQLVSVNCVHFCRAVQVRLLGLAVGSTMEEPPFSFATIEVYHQLKVVHWAYQLLSFLWQIYLSLKIYSSCRNWFVGGLHGRWVDLFALPRNMDDSNMCAGRSVCAVDRMGTGKSVLLHNSFLYFSLLDLPDSKPLLSFLNVMVSELFFWIAVRQQWVLW
jgi:hypothetical protein